MVPSIVLISSSRLVVGSSALNAEPAAEALPPLYETWWLLAACGAALLIVTVALLVRDRRQQARLRRLELEVERRTRDLRRVKQMATRQVADCGARLKGTGSATSGDSGPEPEATQGVARALRNAQRVVDLVDQLLAVNRIETGEVEPVRDEDLAAAEAATRAAEPLRDAGEPAADDRPTVLVVDDDPGTRLFISACLARRYQVEEAADGADGLERARELLPDLVVSDVMMPEMDGYALCQALKQDPELDFVPVILLTVKTSTASKLEGLWEGADDYLTKPVDGRELLARIDNLIASRRRLLKRFNRSSQPTAAAGGLPVADGVEITPDGRAFLERVQETIDQHLGDEDFRVDTLADLLAIDRSHLYRRLRELTGVTPSALILELRLQRAAKILADAGSVGEAAKAVGFKDTSHFTKRFRSRFQITPSVYRRRPPGRTP